MRNIGMIQRVKICLVVFLVVFGMAVPCRAASSGTSNEGLRNAISQYLCNWAVDGYSSAYRDITVDADVYSLSTVGGSVTAKALVTVVMTLIDKRVGDTPTVQGMLSVLSLTDYDPGVSLSTQIATTKTKLTEQQQLCAEAELNDWYEELSGYVNKPFSGNLMLTLEGKLMLGDRLEEPSVQLFALDGDDLVLAARLLPEPAPTRQQEGVAHMNEILRNPRLPETLLRYTYDRLAARDYADEYVETISTYPYYDTSNWNPNYVAHTGGDCVNYVSQALSTGGLPEDSVWKPEGTAWLTLASQSNSFLPHMSTMGYLVDSDYTWANAGALRVFLNSVDHTTPEHIVMITRNDLSTRWYSGHTYDQKQMAYSNQADRLYYKIAGA